jgi:putative hydrolase of the HAD superfamily
VLALFDLDNTLTDRQVAFTAWAREFIAEHGIPTDALEWLTHTDEDGFLPRPDFFHAVHTRYRLNRSPADLQHDYERRYPDFTHCPTATREALADLRARGWQIGVVTNGLTTIQTRVLDQAGLFPYLDTYCVSETEKIRKPDPRIFQRAAERAGTDLQHAWMIGDNPTADITGGRNAGLRTIWIHRGQRWGSGPSPDHIAADVPQAGAILRRNEVC